MLKMVNKLKRRFVILTSVVSLVVMLVIMMTLNISSYVNMCTTADNTIARIYNTGNDAPSFSSRYFTATIRDGEIIDLDVNHIFSFESENTINVESSTSDEEIATRLTYDILALDKYNGFENDFRFGIFDNNNDGTQTLISLDTAMQRETFAHTLNISLIISIVAFCAMTLLSYLFSGHVVKPIVEGYERQKTFITDASHELKTPLTVINANMEILEMTSGENKWIDKTKDQVTKLTKLTNELVFLSKMEEEKRIHTMRPFALDDFDEAIVEPYKAIASQRKYSFTTDFDRDLIITGEKESIYRLVIILLDNAMKYTEEKGTINLYIKKDKKVRIGVKNTCKSFSKGKHDEIFDRFYRADKSRNSKTGGSGIGLAIASAITRVHNGKISAISDGQFIDIFVEI